MSIERPKPLVIIPGVMNSAEGEIVEREYGYRNHRQLALSVPIDHDSYLPCLQPETLTSRQYINDTSTHTPPFYDWNLVDADGNRFSTAFDQSDGDTLLLANLHFHPATTGWSWLPDRVRTTIGQADWVDGVQFSPNQWDDVRNGALAGAERVLNSMERISLLEIQGDALRGEVTPRRLAEEIGHLAVNDNSYVLLKVPEDADPSSLLPYIEAIYEKRDFGDLSRTGVGVSGVSPTMDSLSEVLTEFPEISVAFDEDSSEGQQSFSNDFIKRCLDLLDIKV